MQIAMVDLTDSGATLANWSTQRFKATGTTAGTSLCARAFDSYMRDIDISPDGSFFLVVTTGAYRAGTLCDTASRWETYGTGDQVETSSNYAGGDTFWGLQVTGPIAYVGGHFVGRTIPTPVTGPASGPWRVKGSPRSTPETDSRCPGTRGVSEGSNCLTST